MRIEDIDPPREVPGAAAAILRTLEAFELEWDRPVLYQSSRLEAYRAIAEQLLASGHAFRCRCSRSEIRAGNETPSARYPGTCRTRQVPPGDAAIRARVDPGLVAVDDGLQGATEVDLSASSGDYVIVRRDGLPAYHLAVVVDDAEQGVTTVVRGVDLLESTAAHVHLQACARVPRAALLPLAGRRQRAAAEAIEADGCHADRCRCSRRRQRASWSCWVSRCRQSSARAAGAFCGAGRSTTGASTRCAAVGSSRSADGRALLARPASIH